MHDRMLGRAEEKDYVPDAVLDEIAIEEAARDACAHDSAASSRDLVQTACETALEALALDNATAAAVPSNRARRRAATAPAKAPMRSIAVRYNARSAAQRDSKRIASPQSRVERSLLAGAERARSLRAPLKPLRRERLLDFVASGPALAVWFIVAATTWWLLPTSWDGGEKVAHRRAARSSAAALVDSAEARSSVAAPALTSREELLRRVAENPLSVQAYKRIDEIREGDLVVALDEASGELVARPVTRLFRNTSDHLREVTYATADGAEHKIETTDEHPFWTEREGWTPAKELQPGDEFRQANGDEATLLATLYVEEPDGVAVYNFEVEGAHNYFVASPNTIRGPPGDSFAARPYAGTVFADSVFGDALLVHNQCKPTIQELREAGLSAERAIGLTKNTARITSYTPKVAFRVPDALNKRFLREVKNVNYLRFTPQLRDYLRYAQWKNLRFVLYAGERTKLSRQLQALVSQRLIIHRTPFP